MSRTTKIAAAFAVAGAVLWLAFGFFGIQSAFTNNTVSEADPFSDAAAPATTTQPSSSEQSASSIAPTITAVDVETTEQIEVVAPEPMLLATGSLVDHAHHGEGTANVLTNGTQTFLRFEDDFAIDNGPDLNVYLVRGASAEGDTDLFDDDFVDLGDLKGNIGAQNYEVPSGVEIAEYDTVVIWCVRFSIAFNAADLA